MFTLVIRPRIESGVVSCRTRLRITMLTVSAAPVSARQTNDSRNACERPNTTVARPYSANRPQQDLAATIDVIDDSDHHEAGEYRADRRRGR